MAFLCVDIGGTNTLIGIGDSEFQIIDKIETEKFLKNVEKYIDQAISATDYTVNQIQKVAIAAAGPIDREEKTFRPPNFSGQGLEEVDLGDIFEDFGEIYIINDGTSAVLGEYHYGDHGVENLVYLTISSGIGAGVILEGNPVQAWNGNFAEVGHMKISQKQVECGCGKIGHWEAYSSGENLPNMAKELFDLDFADAKEVFEASEKGDPEAEKVMGRMHEANVTGVSNIVNMFNPEKIVLGGAIPLNHPELILEPLKNNVPAETINKAPEISICDLGERSVLHGLRAVCNEEFKPSQD